MRKIIVSILIISLTVSGVILSGVNITPAYAHEEIPMVGELIIPDNESELLNEWETWAPYFEKMNIKNLMNPTNIVGSDNVIPVYAVTNINNIYSMPENSPVIILHFTSPYQYSPEDTIYSKYSAENFMFSLTDYSDRNLYQVYYPVPLSPMISDLFHSGTGWIFMKDHPMEFRYFEPVLFLEPMEANTSPEEMKLQASEMNARIPVIYRAGNVFVVNIPFVEDPSIIKGYLEAVSDYINKQVISGNTVYYQVHSYSDMFFADVPSAEYKGSYPYAYYTATPSYPDTATHVPHSLHVKMARDDKNVQINVSADDPIETAEIFFSKSRRYLPNSIINIISPYPSNTIPSITLKNNKGEFSIPDGTDWIATLMVHLSNGHTVIISPLFTPMWDSYEDYRNMEWVFQETPLNLKDDNNKGVFETMKKFYPILQEFSDKIDKYKEDYPYLLDWSNTEIILGNDYIIDEYDYNETAKAVILSKYKVWETDGMHKGVKIDIVFGDPDPSFYEMPDQQFIVHPDEENIDFRLYIASDNRVILQKIDKMDGSIETIFDQSDEDRERLITLAAEQLINHISAMLPSPNYPVDVEIQVSNNVEGYYPFPEDVMLADLFLKATITPFGRFRNIVLNMPNSMSVGLIGKFGIYANTVIAKNNFQYVIDNDYVWPVFPLSAVSTMYYKYLRFYNPYFIINPDSMLEKNKLVDFINTFINETDGYAVSKDFLLWLGGHDRMVTNGVSSKMFIPFSMKVFFNWLNIAPKKFEQLSNLVTYMDVVSPFDPFDDAHFWIPNMEMIAGEHFIPSSLLYWMDTPGYQKTVLGKLQKLYLGEENNNDKFEVIVDTPDCPQMQGYLQPFHIYVKGTTVSDYSWRLEISDINGNETYTEYPANVNGDTVIFYLDDLSKKGFEDKFIIIDVVKEDNYGKKVIKTLKVGIDYEDNPSSGFDVSFPDNVISTNSFNNVVNIPVTFISHQICRLHVDSVIKVSYDPNSEHVIEQPISFYKILNDRSVTISIPVYIPWKESYLWLNSSSKIKVFINSNIFTPTSGYLLYR